MSLNRVWIPSPNHSDSRQRNQLLVIHTAEGANTFRDLGSFFSNPSCQVSSHVGIDNTPDQIGEFLKPDMKAWAAFNGNEWGEHAELCGFAAWSRVQWLQNPVMLKNTHKWLKEEGARYGIPLVKLTADDIRAGKKGVCGHKDLTDAGAGGDHWDPGTGFPWDAVLGGGIVNTGAHAPAASNPTSSSAPAFPGRMIRVTSPMMTGTDVSTWQAQMKRRGWNISTDGIYGQGSENVCKQFQAEKGLGADGIVGPNTWSASWTSPL